MRSSVATGEFGGGNLRERVIGLILAVGIVVAYFGAYWMTVHRHYDAFSATDRFVWLSSTEETLFAPAIWIDEQLSGNDVSVKPLVVEDW